MVAFKTMWSDVEKILSKEELDIDIIERYSSGFAVREANNTTFVTRDDFVDFWCRLLYYSEVDLSALEEGDLCKKCKYICTILKKLPYVNEKSGVMTICE